MEARNSCSIEHGIVLVFYGVLLCLLIAQFVTIKVFKMGAKNTATSTWQHIVIDLTLDIVVEKF